MIFKDIPFVKFIIEIPEEQKRWATLILCCALILWQSHRNDKKEETLKKEFISVIQDHKIEKAILRKELSDCKDDRFEDANYFRDKFLELKKSFE